MPDLVFTNITYKISFINTTNSVTYWDVRVIGTLTNNGSIFATSSTSSSGLSRVGSTSGYGQAIPTPSIMPRVSTKVRWNFVGYTGQYSMWFHADVFNNVTEFDETNNFIGTIITLP